MGKKRDHGGFCVCVGGFYICCSLSGYTAISFFSSVFFLLFFLFFGVFTVRSKGVMENGFVNIISFQTNETT